MAIIEKLLVTHGEKSISFLHRFFIPRLRVSLLPIIPLLPDLANDISRKGIRQPPCQENPDTALLPVGEVRAVFFDWIFRVEEHPGRMT